MHTAVLRHWLAEIQALECKKKDTPQGVSFFCLVTLSLVVFHAPDDGGELAAGEGVAGLIGAGAVGEVALHDARGAEGLDIDVGRVGGDDGAP